MNYLTGAIDCTLPRDISKDAAETTGAISRKVPFVADGTGRI
jgi:hypothetical protein